MQEDRFNGIVGSLGMKAPVRLATTANITLSGLQTVDGVTTVAGDRVLVKDQTDQTENGIYVASTGPWRRSTDFDGPYDAVTGTTVICVWGNTNGGRAYQLYTDAPVIGTTALYFSPALIRDVYPGAVIQSVEASFSTYQASNSVIPIDGSIPQYSEGTALVSATITPKLADSTIRVTVIAHIEPAGGVGLVMSLFKGVGPNAVAAMHASPVMQYTEAAVDTAERTYYVRFGPDAVGFVHANALTTGVQPFGAGKTSSRILVEEIAAG